MNVPLLDLKAQYAAIMVDVDAAIAEVMEVQHFISTAVVVSRRYLRIREHR